MKRTIAIAGGFLFTLGLTLGVVIGLNDDAQAGYGCVWHCTFTTVMSSTTGPLCPGTCQPDDIYYVYRKSTCTGGPLNCPYVYEPIGCWDGENPLVLCLL